MRTYFERLSLDDLLSDDLIQTVMRADNVDPASIIALHNAIYRRPIRNRLFRSIAEILACRCGWRLRIQFRWRCRSQLRMQF